MTSTNDNSPAPQDNDQNKGDFPGYPKYLASEDIYSQSSKEAGIDPEDPSRLKEIADPNELEGDNEKDFKHDRSGSDLDVPGAELDDADEITGNEDEENNYYSLGGDNHENLDEDNGD